MLRRRAHRELIEVGLADGDGAGGVQPRDRRAVDDRREVREHPRGCGRRDALGGEKILHGDRYTREGSALTRSEPCVGGARLLKGEFVRHGHVGVEGVLLHLDAGEGGLREGDRGVLAGPQRGGVFVRGAVEVD